MSHVLLALHTHTQLATFIFTLTIKIQQHLKLSSALCTVKCCICAIYQTKDMNSSASSKVVIANTCRQYLASTLALIFGSSAICRPLNNNLCELEAAIIKPVRETVFLDFCHFSIVLIKRTPPGVFAAPFENLSHLIRHTLNMGGKVQYDIFCP